MNCAGEQHQKKEGKKSKEERDYGRTLNVFNMELY